jgi:type IV pilus assembly protein PilA
VANSIETQRQRIRAYTLIELMVVTSIVGVLATLAVFGVRKYIAASKAGEAVGMLAAIKAAEEQYRDETFVYLGTDDFGAWHPASTPGKFKTDWRADNGAASDVMQTLGVDAAGPVYFTYAVVAGRAGDAFPTPPTAQTNFNFPNPAAEPFYVAVARADLDGDGSFSYALSHSLSSEVYVENQGE